MRHLRYIKCFPLLVAFISLTVQLAAAESFPVARGATRVQLASQLVTALTSLGVAPGVVGPTTIKRGVASFPITAGIVDPQSGMELAHSGGLTFTGGQTVVTLNSFIIDTTTAPPRLTGLVTVNGAFVGRAPLFTITVSPGGGVTLRNNRKKATFIGTGFALTLTAEAADALNRAFNVTAFSAGIPVGDASFRARSVRK